MMCKRYGHRLQTCASVTAYSKLKLAGAQVANLRQRNCLKET
jgi:hypothetical protein